MKIILFLLPLVCLNLFAGTTYKLHLKVDLGRCAEDSKILGKGFQDEFDFMINGERVQKVGDTYIGYEIDENSGKSYLFGPIFEKVISVKQYDQINVKFIERDIIWDDIINVVENLSVKKIIESKHHRYIHKPARVKNSKQQPCLTAQVFDNHLQGIDK